MYCVNCGTKLENGANFCSNCGFKCSIESTAVKTENLFNISKYVGLSFDEIGNGRHFEILDKGVEISREKKWLLPPFSNFIPFERIITVNIRYPSFGLPNGILTIKTSGGGLDSYYLNSGKFNDAAIIGSDPNTIIFLKNDVDKVRKIYEALLDIQRNYSV